MKIVLIAVLGTAVLFLTVILIALYSHHRSELNRLETVRVEQVQLSTRPMKTCQIRNDPPEVTGYNSVGAASAYELPRDSALNAEQSSALSPEQNSALNAEQSSALSPEQDSVLNASALTGEAFKSLLNSEASVAHCFIDHPEHPEPVEDLYYEDDGLHE